MPILFADDASVLYSHTDPLQFKNKLYEVYWLLDDWFKRKLLSLNTGKTYCITFTANNKVERDIGKLGALIKSTNHIKFLGLTIECSLSWESHIDEIIQKLSLACYMIRNIKPLMSLNTLKNIYHSYFHSVMTYGLIYWGNSSYAEKVFKMQKRVIRLIKGCGYRESCRDHFKEMNILPLKSQYIYSLMTFVTKNHDKFVINKNYYEVNARQNVNLHMYQVNLAKYDK
jgi:hypothetical protein